MATENRTPDDLQEAVAATLRRLRGEVGKPGATPAAPRVEPQLSAAAPEEPAPAVVSPVNQEIIEPDLLSRSEPEIPPAPASTLGDGGAERYRLEPARARSRLLPYALSFVAIVVFAGIVWWAYRAIVTAPNKGPVPTIAADLNPAKVPPADQQSTDTTGQQQTVYDQISGTTTQPKTETLLPTPEAPQTPPPPPTPVPSTTDAGSTASAPAADSGSATQTLVPPPAPLAPATTGSTTAPAATADTSTAGAASGTTGTTGTDTSGAGTTASDTSSGMAATADAGSTATQPASGTDTGSTTGTNTGSSADTVTTNPSTDAAELYGVPMLAPTAPAAGAAATTDTTDTTGTTNVASADTSGGTESASVADNFRIQLAALKSEAEANKTWKRILAKHTDVLGSLTVHIVRADLGTQGIYYRVQAGPFADKASAAAVCDQLKSAGQQCLVKP